MNLRKRGYGFLCYIAMAACLLALFGCGSGSSGNSSTPSIANFSTGSVAGTVTIANSGPPDTNAAVVLTPQANTNLPPLTTKTDGSGNFQFSSVPIGSWLISVPNTTLVSPSSGITVQAGTTTTVNLTVTPVVTSTN